MTQARVMLVGDVMVGEREVNALLQTATHSTKTACFPLYDNIDLLVGNLEVPLTNRGYPAEKLIAWRTSPAVVPFLAQLGFNVLTLANNHMLDYDVVGLLDTIDALRGAGIVVGGAGENLEDALRPTILRLADGTKLAILSVTCSLPPGCAAGEKRPGVAPIQITTSFTVSRRFYDSPGVAPIVKTQPVAGDVSRVTDSIRQLKQSRHIVVVYIHWGIGFTTALADYQRELIDQFVSAGVDMIAGHHPHILQGLQVISQVPVFYSSGNCIIHQSVVNPGTDRVKNLIGETWGMDPDAIVPVMVIRDGRFVGVEIIPTHVRADGLGRRATGAEAERILDRAWQLSQSFGTKWEIKEEIGWLPLAGMASSDGVGSR